VVDGGIGDEGQIKGRTLRLGRSIVFAWIFRQSGNVQLRTAMCGEPPARCPKNYFSHISSVGSTHPSSSQVAAGIDSASHDEPRAISYM
jgi:hypothetical protein